MARAANQVADQSLSPGQYSGTDAGRERPRLALDFDTDRSSAFRRARVHSVIVSVLRIALPVMSVALFASYGIFVQRSVKISLKQGQVTVDSASVSTEALIAHNPKYEGFDKQGGHFVVHAVTAEQDFGQKGPVRLKTIDGQMIDANKTVTNLKARTGSLDTKTNVLELYEKIDVEQPNGMTAELTRATVLTKEGRITSDQPVIVRMPTGVVRGRTMVIEQKLRQITFDKGVVARLKQEQPKDRPVAAAKAAAAGKGGDASPFGASDAPVDITSVKLFIDDNTKLAVFSGNVVAVQNDSTLQTAQLEVTYEGQAAAGDAKSGAAPTAKPAATDPTASSKVKRLYSRTEVVLTRGIERATGRSAEFDAVTDRAVLLGSVVITSGPDKQATSDRAEMDNRNDTALLTGNVVVTQIKNVLKGRRLFVDRKSNTMQMTAPAEAGVPKGRISARMYQAENEAAATASAAKKGAPAPNPAPAAAAPAKGGPMTLHSDPSQPIDVDADQLDVDDRTKKAIFRGKVVAVQGDYTIRTEELVVTYSGEAGMTLGPQAAADPKAADPKAGDKAGDPKDPAAKSPGAQLQRVQATRRVIVTTKDGRTVTGNTADFEAKANVVTVDGDVTIAENGASTLTGPRATIDLATNNMKMVSPGTSQTAANPQALQAGQSPQAPPKPQRYQVLLYPKDKDGKAKQGAPAAPAAPAAPVEAVPTLPQQAPSLSSSRRSPGWSSNDPFQSIGQ